VRVNRARRLLTDTDKPVRQISAECGFSDQGYFTKVFSAATGYAPTDFRRILQEDENALSGAEEIQP